MKKASVIVQAKDADSALNRLRSLGLLHVEHTKPPKGDDINILLDDIALIDSINKVLSEEKFSPAIKEQIQNKQLADWRFSARHIIDLSKRFSQLEEFSVNLNKSITDWQEWGDFDPDSIRSLSQKNVFIRLYKIPVKQLKELRLPSSVILKRISVIEGMVNCVFISREKIDIPYKEVILPKMSLAKMKQRIAEDMQVMGLIKSEIQNKICYKESFAAIKNTLQKELEFHQALRGMAEVGTLAYIVGYLPYDRVDTLKDLAKKEKWGIFITEPSSEDNVPVLLRNPRWVRLIEPVMKLLGIMPGYQEIDVSLVFLIFFSIFFGILIGDAGYGLSYLLLTIWFQRKEGVNAQNANIFLLFYLLSSCAIGWGILTGSFFGQEWLAMRGIKPLASILNEPHFMQTICFFLGALHLTIAHGWRALLKFPSQNFLSDLGWIAVLWIAYFLARTLILGEVFPSFGLPIAICGIILVLFFSEPRRNLLKRLGAGFTSVTFGLSFMSAFTDVVSYVRLFAVGLAAVAIANTTNAMAAGLGKGVIAFFGGILITIVGHGLNIILGPIAILVHGIRLNVLEFGLNHTNITWSGNSYKPLQEIS